MVELNTNQARGAENAPLYTMIKLLTLAIVLAVVAMLGVIMFV